MSQVALSRAWEDFTQRHSDLKDTGLAHIFNVAAIVAIRGRIG